MWTDVWRDVWTCHVPRVYTCTYECTYGRKKGACVRFVRTIVRMRSFQENTAIRKAVSNVRRKGVLGQKTPKKTSKNETPLLGELSETNRDLVEL